jgi:hypothetical protein
MKVRGWLIIGNSTTGWHLPLEKAIFGGSVSIGAPILNAMDYQPGDWMRWSPSMGTHALTLVCVEIPL